MKWDEEGAWREIKENEEEWKGMKENGRGRMDEVGWRGGVRIDEGWWMSVTEWESVKESVSVNEGMVF